MSFKNKVSQFLTLSGEGYESMSPKEVALWYAAAIPVNVAYFKLIRRQRFAPAIGLGLVMTSALMLRSFTLGLRLRKGECPPRPHVGAQAQRCGQHQEGRRGAQARQLGLLCRGGAIRAGVHEPRRSLVLDL